MVFIKTPLPQATSIVRLCRFFHSALRATGKSPIALPVGVANSVIFLLIIMYLILDLSNQAGSGAAGFGNLLPDCHSFLVATGRLARQSGKTHRPIAAGWRRFDFYIDYSIIYLLSLEPVAAFVRFRSMAITRISRALAAPSGWAIAVDSPTISNFSSDNHRLVTISGVLADPEYAISQAFLQKFAKITPQYPGVRAPLDPAVCGYLLGKFAPLLDQWFAGACTRWEMQAWYSLVTTPPAALAPIQRLPHIDGTDPRQIAMMLYLHRTGHGGTAFFRHRSTGLESLTAQDYPRYAAALRADVARTGLPPAAYATDGAPHFERIHTAPGDFNSAIFYRGNILHSGVIDNAAPLVADPRAGRLTINAFFRPAAD